MRLGIVGCGYVSDYYIRTLKLYPELELVGVMDKIPERAQQLAQKQGVTAYETLEELLAGDRVELVLNLTNPRSHFAVSEACLKAGKHVYSEKPLAMDFEEAKQLVELAKSRNLYLSGAPCTVLGETAQTLWKAIREEKIGAIRAIYAEMDDGMVHLYPYQKWINAAGIPWPYKDEFEVGCTIERAGYVLTWLLAFFGPAESVTAFSSCLIPDKKTSVPLDREAPDFSVACIKFASGLVARITCSIVARHDHELKFYGEDGILSTHDCWDERNPVKIQKLLTIRRKTFMSPKINYPLVGKNNPKVKSPGSQNINFARGVAELAQAIAEKRPSRLSADFCLHVTEIVLGIDNALDTACPYKLTTTFAPMEPMPYV